jgi:crotonobetainyl-CoA:carnitine CoA-transferase CaiB-like acyl-CoA transferase
MLGDLGADVLKVESPAGDSMRWIGPWRHPGMGPLYLQANRNKRGIVLDLKSPEGKARVVALAERADILVSNVRPQGLQRLGLDYERVSAVNPKIIYCAAVGYGAGGPDSGKAVYDDLTGLRAMRLSIFAIASSACTSPTPSPPHSITAKRPAKVN